MDLTVVATYNVHVSASDADTLADLRALLAEADILVVQEVPSAGKKAVIARVQDETGVKVVYSPGRAEDAIIWHPNQVLMKAKGAAVLSDPTAVGNPGVTIRTKYLTWCRFRLRGTLTHFPVGVVHLVPKPHVDPRREALLKLEVHNLATALLDLGFKKPLIGGDYNVDYDDPWLRPLRDIGMLNAHRVLGELNTFPASAPDRSFDQWWFRPPTQTGFRPLEHHTFAGASDHLGVVVSFAVQ